MRTFGGEDDAPQDPFDIKDGPDGWLWFTDKAGNALGRIYAGRSRQRGRSWSLGEPHDENCDMD